MFVPYVGISMSRGCRVSVALPTIRRLPMYFAILQRAAAEGQNHISSAEIAATLRLESIQVRKDLAAVGVAGQPRLGFPIAELIRAIEVFLGWDNTTDAFIVGAGHLGTALAGYRGFAERGLNVVALFDNDVSKIGRKVHGKVVFGLEKFADLTERLGVHIAILTVPEEQANSAAALAVEAGIQAIWNFTATKLIVPEHVVVERVDLAASLAVLSSRVVAQRRRLQG